MKKLTWPGNAADALDYPILLALPSRMMMIRALFSAARL
jgi:hypothetical protein